MSPRHRSDHIEKQNGHSRLHLDLHRIPTNYSLITGPTGCSKSTVALIMTMLYDTPTGSLPRIIWRDTSKLLNNSKHKKTKAGLQLLEMEHLQKAGVVLDAGPVTASITENISWLPGRNRLELITLAGSSRHPDETEFWLKMPKGLVAATLIEATDQQVEDAIYRRIETGEMREDDGPGTLAKKLDEYRTKIRPAAEMFPHLLRLHRDMPLNERVSMLVDYLHERGVLSQTVHTDWKKKLGNRNHAANIAIRDVESHKPVTARRHHPQTFDHYLPVSAQATVAI